jgi:hypothetical protein
MSSWDRRSPKQQKHTLARALSAQVVHGVGPFSPYWREVLAGLGTTARAASTVTGLAALPAAGERDVCPDGDPAAAARLVLQAKESGWALHAEGPALRKAMASRLARSSSYRALVEADTRPTTYVEAGLAFTFPVASTRRDLDVVARAGARLWQVLGLTREDVLVSALPHLRSASLQALELGALAAGTPAMFPGDDVDEVTAALRLVPATVLAMATGTAVSQLDDLDEAGAPLSGVRVLLLVGAPDDLERAEVEQALVRARSSAQVRVMHVPDGHRLAWGECAPGSGLHTYPDLELVQLIDAETGAPIEELGEVVLTQLGMRGSALLRWRTGDVAESVETGKCPGCGRTVPRVVGVARSALVRVLELRTGSRAVDLRAVAGALEGRPDVQDWRVVAGRSGRDGADELLVHLVPHAHGDDSEMAVAVARDVRAAAGLLPSQIVVDGELPNGVPLTRRVLLRG